MSRAVLAGAFLCPLDGLYFVFEISFQQRVLQKKNVCVKLDTLQDVILCFQASLSDKMHCAVHMLNDRAFGRTESLSSQVPDVQAFGFEDNARNRFQLGNGMYIVSK